MGRFRVLKNSLLGGQISRDALGRTDLPQYAHACELLENMIPILSGGAYRRPGTIYQDFIPANALTPDDQGLVHEYQSSPPRIFPFIVSQQIAYAIVIGTMRTSFLQVTPPLGSNPGGAYLKIYRATGNKNNTFVSDLVYGALPYRCKSSAVAATLTGETIYTRQGGPGAVANSGAMITSGTTIIDVADSLETYDDDIWSVQHCQANDVMFLTHPDYQPQTLWLFAADQIHASPYDYTLTGLKLAQSRPYLNQNSTAATLKLTYSGSPTPGDSMTLTSSTAFFDPLHGPRTGTYPEGAPAPINDGAFFALAVSEGSSFGVGGIIFVQVLSVTSSTVCTVKLLTALPSGYSSGTTTTSWWESAWSNYRGWPRACAIFQQRLVMAGTKHQPNALWFTATTSYGAPISLIADATACKFTALGDGPSRGIVAGATGVLANGRNYTTPQDWVYYPVDDSQGDGQSTGPLGSQPFRISLATTSLDAIQYLSPDQQLFIGTATQEWICAAVNGSFDVANSDCTIQSHYGSDLVQAIRIGYEMVFVMGKKDEIRAYQYNYFDQSFFGEPVQLFFDEYPGDEEGAVAIANPLAGRKKFRQIDWDSSRSTLWCVSTAGDFFGLTRDRKLAVTSWHTHQMGGFNADHGQGQNQTDNLSGGNHYTDSANYLCDGSVVSLASLPNPLSGIRDLWMVVKRSVGNDTIYSIERMVGANTVRKSAYSDVAPGNAQEPLYVDCAYFLTDNGDPTNFDYNIGNFGHSQLVGDTLVGTYYSEAWGMFAIECQAPVASDGAISLQTNLPPDYGTAATHTMVVGLQYDSIVQPVRADPPSPVGTSQGAIKRISKTYLRLFKTLMLKCGTPPDPNTGQPARLEPVRFKPGATMAKSSEIYTGDKEVFVPGTFDRNGYLYILQDKPLPFTLVSLSLEGVEYEQ